MQKEKEVRGIQIGKEEIKLSLFVVNIMFYVENPNESTKKVPELFSFSKFARYKINIQKSFVFLNTNNEQMKCEIEEMCVQIHT